jgi:hypothetical protein
MKILTKLKLKPTLSKIIQHGVQTGGQHVAPNMLASFEQAF